MFSHYVSKKIRYYGTFQLLNVIILVLISSFGAFFHFLLDHEISIVESWLHQNHWPIVGLSKIGSFLILNWWFRVRLYQMKSLKEMAREMLSWPDHRAIVLSFFILISTISLCETIYVSQNVGYLYNHFISSFSIVLFYGIDFVVLAYLEDILGEEADRKYSFVMIAYVAIFFLSFRLSIPDYYNQFQNVFFCFTTLIYLSGKSYKKWGNILSFLFVFVAPMGAIFGVDPIWGEDFSPFKLKSSMTPTFLLVIWMISFSYYKYRDRIIFGFRKLIR